MAISDEAKHVEKFGEPLDVSKDKTQGIISAAKTSMKAKQLAPEDTHLDLIREEEELGVPVLPLSRNLDTSEHISKIVHILVQLLQADEFVGRDAVHKALMALLSQDLKASLSALFKHIGSVDEPSQDDVIHEEVLRFIREKVFPIRDEILKPQEMERHITDLIKKSSEDVSGADFRMFMDFLYGLSICGEKAPKEQMLELIGIIEGQAFYAYYPLWVALSPEGKISENFTGAATSHICESVCLKESTKTSQEGGEQMALEIEKQIDRNKSKPGLLQIWRSVSD